ncbi:MAG: tetraacyldisaccharide 4'-kinase [Candidatus Omnitrophota bacterium]|nr:MAG: tetraacyldisaccharide 4'-kinase [Candidatus Omnitrophota bacterium]
MHDRIDRGSTSGGGRTSINSSSSGGGRTSINSSSSGGGRTLINSSKIDQFIKSCLLILSYAYGFLVKAHYFFYKVNLLKSYKPQIAIISIGNITLGGTGKTPFTIMLAKRLTQKNRKKTAVLIRGYGEDEWRLLEDRLGKHGIKVFVGRDRVKYARRALQYGIDSLVLDDGFQHRRLKRDLDIVLLDSTNPFGNRHLFPRGILREPFDSLRRADIVVLTKVDKTKNIPAIADEIKKIAPGKTIIKAVHKPKALFDIKTGSEKELAFIAGKKVCILSAICDASYFKHTVEMSRARIGLEFVFPDHHPYRARDLDRIFKKCKRENIDTIVTTEKDAVKLRSLTLAESEFKILALRIELEIIQGEEELDDNLHRLYMRYSC